MYGEFSIKTQVGQNIVRTYSYRGKWITIVGLLDNDHLETDSLQHAGQNHLSRCEKLSKDKQ